MKHTQGPWELHRIKHRDENEYAAIYAQVHNGGNVRVASTCDSAAEWEANARLIAAAPLLLEAAQEVVSQLQRDIEQDGVASMHSCSVMRDALMLAIAKATA